MCGHIIMSISQINIKNEELDDTWVLWYHAVENDHDWSNESFEKLYTIKTIGDYNRLMNNIPHITSGRFYLMRQGIFPKREDETNINGGIFSIRISKTMTNATWLELTASTIGETLVKDIKLTKFIKGVSIAPKLRNCVFWIWVSDDKYSNRNILNNDFSHFSLSDIIYSNNRDNLDKFTSNGDKE